MFVQEGIAVSCSQGGLLHKQEMLHSCVTSHSEHLDVSCGFCSFISCFIYLFLEWQRQMSCSLRKKKYLQGEEGNKYMNMQISSQRGTCSDEECSRIH